MAALGCKASGAKLSELSKYIARKKLARVSEIPLDEQGNIG